MILKSEFHAAFFKTITMFRCWILKSGYIQVLAVCKEEIKLFLKNFAKFKKNVANRSLNLA